jgi:O-antigen/teichoic acid export membrane protein
MVMTGHHKKSLPVIGYCLIINLVLHTIAIPTLGMIGSAIATSVTMIISNVWLSFLVVKHIKINPSIFVGFFNPAPESEKTLNG